MCVKTPRNLYDLDNIRSKVASVPFRAGLAKHIQSNRSLEEGKNSEIHQTPTKMAYQNHPMILHTINLKTSIC